MDRLMLRMPIMHSLIMVRLPADRQATASLMASRQAAASQIMDSQTAISTISSTRLQACSHHPAHPAHLAADRATADRAMEVVMPAALVHPIILAVHHVHHMHPAHLMMKMILTSRLVRHGTGL